MLASDLTMRDIYLARQTIAPIAHKTPLRHSAVLGEFAGRSVYLKLENLQETGSFKVRGAANKILNLNPDEQARGVITVSTGNHGRAVAFVAGRLGLSATVCISSRVPKNKVEALRQLGAEVVVHGQSQDEAEQRAIQLQQERGLTFIHPFDDPLIIAGQGTIGLELLEELPVVDTVVVPLSGGGLISGVALGLKSADPAIRVIGVSMERAPVMYHSLRAGTPVELQEEQTLADSLAGGIGLSNRYTFGLVQRLVDDIVLVSEEEIAEAMAFALRQQHLILEGGASVGIAALLHRKAGNLGQHVAVVISGWNVDSDLLLQLVEERR